MALGGLGLLTIAGLCASWLLESDPRAGESTPHGAIPAAAASKASGRVPLAFANQRPGVAYAGNDACANCHAGIAESFARHGMARTFGPADPAHLLGDWSGQAVVVDSLNGYRYTPYRAGDRAYIREVLLDIAGREIHRVERAVDLTIGSGKNDQAFAEERNGFLRILPLEWYSEAGRWDFAPMYERENRRFSRLANHRCLSCHTGTPELLSEPATRLGEPLPAAVTCERCHGPGELHVAARLAGWEPAGIDTTIVNPRHLPPARQIDVCAQCHLQGDSELLARGRRTFDFRPGERLDAHRAVFVSADAGRDTADFGFVRHVERMVQSRCYTASGGALTCTSCHDPHVTSAGHPAARWDDACLKCHARDDCSSPPMPNATTETAGSCVACHMRRSEPYDVRHVTITDHWIRRRIEPPTRAAATRFRPDMKAPLARFRLPEETVPLTPADWELHAVAAMELGLDADARMALNAATKNGRELADPRAASVAARLLAAGGDSAGARRALARAAADPACPPRILAESARLEAALGGRATSVELVGKARAQDPHDPELLRAAAEIQAHTDPGRAAVLYADARILDPRDRAAIAGEAQSLLAAGKLRAAADAYAELAAEEPRDSQTHAALAYCRAAVGQPDLAIPSYERALALEPNAHVYFNYGNALAAAHAPARAETAYREAIRLDPGYYPAYGNLGFLLLARGDSAAARQVFDRVIELAPDDPIARRMQEILQ
jgi:tetratricopeptide (TPR) repeat protein